MRFDDSFIKRCGEIAKPKVEEYLQNRREKINKWNKENPEKLKSSQNAYLKSEKGKAARKRVISKRKSWIKECLKFLTKEEKQRIKEIYSQRRKYREYEIDHIIPICEGGTHHPNNLRLVHKTENRTKGKKIV